jgi:hypothetical protein
MLRNQHTRERGNTVKHRLTPTPADWLLAQYDATDPGDLAEGAGHDQSAVQPIYTLKSQHEPGQSMRVTASDYGDTYRWWL